MVNVRAVDARGELVLVELKRDKTPREAVAQALDYASWLDSTSESVVLEIAEEHLQKPLEDAYAEKFGGEEMPAITPQNHKILLVAAKLDSSSERIINYLAQRHSVNINAIFFRYARLNDTTEVLIRSVLVAESQKSTGAKRKFTTAELLNKASSRGVLPLVEPFRSLLAKDEEYVSETPSSAYGGSFRNWRRDTTGNLRMVLGINVSGDRQETPLGQLDLWIPVPTLAQVSDTPEQQVREMLKKLPVLEMKYDCILRVADQDKARKVATRLREWFDEHPGYYRKTATSPST